MMVNILLHHRRLRVEHHPAVDELPALDPGVDALHRRPEKPGVLLNG